MHGGIRRLVLCNELIEDDPTDLNFRSTLDKNVFSNQCLSLTKPGIKLVFSKDKLK